MEEYVVELAYSESNDPILTVNKKPLQNLQNPKKFEYECIAKNKIDTDASLILVYGHAFGYTADAILKLHPEAKNIIIYEPVKELFNLTVPKREDLFRDERVYLANSVNIFISQFEALYNPKETVVVYTVPGWGDYFKVPFEEFMYIVERRINIRKNSSGETGKIQKTEAENILRNLPKHTYNSDIKEIIHFGNKKPVVICSEGKYLEDTENLDLLKENRDRVLIIATERSYSTLILNEIEPHFVVAVSPREDVCHTFEKYGSYENTCLVMPVTAHHKLQDLGFKKVFSFVALNTTYKAWLFDSIQEQFSFDVGKDVDHTAFSLGVMLGCSPVVLLGFDEEHFKKEFYKEWMEASSTTITREMKHETKLYNASNSTIEGYENKPFKDIWEEVKGINKHFMDVRVADAQPLPWQPLMLGDMLQTMLEQIQARDLKNLRLNPLALPFTDLSELEDIVKETILENENYFNDK